MIAALALLAGSYRSQYPLPSLRVPDGWGVNIHFTHEQPGELEHIAKVFRWVRMDFDWAGIEKTKGVYDFSDYDALMAGLDSHHLRAYFILDYGNDLYQDGSPRTDQSRAAFCRFVEAAVKHYRHRGVVWEMWNEPNIDFWKPMPDVTQYAALALAVGKTIRRVAPDEWYIGPATSTFDWKFLQACFDSGCLDYWDAVSVHPYRGDSPESVIADWDKLRGMIAAHGKHVPMISGEWGYSSLTGGVSPQTQADYMARQYLTNLSDGVPISIWYDWKNDGTNPADNESNFGSVDSSGVEKPAFQEALSLVGALAGYAFEKRLKTDSPNDFVLQFRNGTRPKIATWSSDSPHKIQNNQMTIEFTNKPSFWP